MSKLLLSLFMCAGIAMAGAASAAPIAKDAYNAENKRIEDQYKADRDACKSMTGNQKDVCVKEAKAAETKVKADAKTTHVAADTRKDAAEDKRTADYKVAVEKCDSLSGDAKTQCVKDAKARYGKS